MLSIKCIKCGDNTKTISTKNRDISIYRRKECLNCGFRFSTIETIEELKVGRREKDPSVKQEELNRKRKLNDILNEEKEEPWFD